MILTLWAWLPVTGREGWLWSGTSNLAPKGRVAKVELAIRCWHYEREGIHHLSARRTNFLEKQKHPAGCKHAGCSVQRKLTFSDG